MGLSLRGRNDVNDARTLSEAESESKIEKQSRAPLADFVRSDEPLVIEFNPTRPRGRLRFSLAHEIAHTLFPMSRRL